MQFEFSTVIEGANCHIRGIGGNIPSQQVNCRTHKHYSMELHCLFSGEETVNFPATKQTIQLTPGYILLLPRDTYHTVSTKDPQVERLCFNFSVEPTTQDGCSILELFMNIQEPILFENTNHTFFAGQCRSLYTEEDRPLAKTSLGILLLSTLLQLLSSTELAQQLPSSHDTKASKQKWVIEKHIENHFTDDMGIDSLADSLGLSQRQARTLVKRFFGEDYKSIIIRRRMELADFYFKDTAKSLEEIAWLVGYRSYSGFQLCYKRYFGMTPSEKRAQLLYSQTE